MQYGCKIESIGAKLPENKVSSEELEKGLKYQGSVKLELLTGIKNRRICNESEDALSLAVDSIADCLNYSDFKVNEIEMIVCCSISKYLTGMKVVYEPAMSLMIKKRIGNSGALNFDISNACAGMATGMHLGKNFIERGVVRNCLIVSGEYISSLIVNAQQRVNSCKHNEFASLTVGDAGVAVMLARTELNDKEGIKISEFQSLSDYSNLCMGYQSQTAPGARMHTDMKKIHEVSIRYAPEFIKNVLTKNKLKINDIDYLIPHQTSRLALRSGYKRLYLRLKGAPGEVVDHISDVGNTASTTHFLAMYSYLKEGRFRNGDKIMLLFLASGITIGTIVFTLNGLIQRYGNGN